MAVQGKLSNGGGKITEGCVRESLRYGKYEVLKILPHRKYLIKFLDSGFEKVVGYSGVYCGEIRDTSAPSVSGVGILCEVKCKVAYQAWCNMLGRCYNKNNKVYQSYGGKGVVVSEEWKTYSNFESWYLDHKVEGWQLDKDLIGDGSVYSEDVCCFLPKAVNVGLASRGYTGCIRGGRYRVRYGRYKEMCFYSKTDATCYYLEGKIATHLGWLTSYPQMGGYVKKKIEELVTGYRNEITNLQESNI